MLFMLVSFVLLIVALIDLLKRPAGLWYESGHNQLVWALVVVLVGFVGPLLYLLIARPALESAAKATTSSFRSDDATLPPDPIPDPAAREMES